MNGLFFHECFVDIRKVLFKYENVGAGGKLDADQAFDILGVLNCKTFESNYRTVALNGNFTRKARKYSFVRAVSFKRFGSYDEPGKRIKHVM